MSDGLTSRTHAWPLAALAGAFAVIMPCALLAAGSILAFARNMATRPGSSAHSDPRRLDEAISSALAKAGVVLMAGTIVGVPVAILLAGGMARLERSHPQCRRLLAWLAGGTVAVSPVILLSAAIIHDLVLALPLFGCALVGAAVAWTVRHRALCRWMSTR